MVAQYERTRQMRPQQGVFQEKVLPLTELWFHTMPMQVIPLAYLLSHQMERWRKDPTRLSLENNYWRRSCGWNEIDTSKKSRNPCTRLALATEKSPGLETCDAWRVTVLWENDKDLRRYAWMRAFATRDALKQSEPASRAGTTNSLAYVMRSSWNWDLWAC